MPNKRLQSYSQQTTDTVNGQTDKPAFWLVKITSIHRSSFIYQPFGIFYSTIVFLLNTERENQGCQSWSGVGEVERERGISRKGIMEWKRGPVRGSWSIQRDISGADLQRSTQFIHKAAAAFIILTFTHPSMCPTVEDPMGNWLLITLCWILLTLWTMNRTLTF